MEQLDGTLPAIRFSPSNAALGFYGHAPIEAVFMISPNAVIKRFNSWNLLVAALEVVLPFSIPANERTEIAGILLTYVNLEYILEWLFVDARILVEA